MKYADIGMATHDANALSPAMVMNSIYTLEALDYGSVAIEVLGADRATSKCSLPGTSKKSRPLGRANSAGQQKFSREEIDTA
ncbi:protein of unknown function [Denitratisoma oestradiolicum]|uniref:Uncharacterized protein n=1 Tax=Denitratisoma oestradiolicum TaxID=311182 RepID=A0A6S6XTC5_9PROT|nr:protein of unknown function [Denitratisoma oestradiolicum]